MRFSILMLFMVVFAVLASPACDCNDTVYPPEGNEGNGFNIVEPTGADVDFVLENESEHTVYYQLGSLPSPGWLSVMLDDQELNVQWDCSLPCACDDPEGCPICGIPARDAQELSPGDEVRMEWDGVSYEVLGSGPDACYEKVQLDGEAMEAEICYGFEREGGDYNETIVDPICETVEFQQGVDREVVVTVDEGPITSPDVQFILKNQLDEDVYIQQGVEPSPGWLAVLLDGSEIHLSWDCALPCECPDPNNPDEPTACMDCGMAGPYAVDIPAGQQSSFSWDGVQYKVTDGCFEKVQRSTEQMVAEFCYGFDVDDNEFESYVADPVCETVEFQPGIDDQVVVTIDDGPDPTPPVAPEVEFILENETDDVIYVQRGTDAVPSWLDVIVDDSSIYIDWTCGMPCPCDEEHNECMVCDPMPPWIEEVAPGDEVSFWWDGVQYVIESYDDAPSCYYTTQLSQKMMEANFCWGVDEQSTDFGAYIDDPICERVDFEFGIDDPVRVVVD